MERESRLHGQSRTTLQVVRRSRVLATDRIPSTTSTPTGIGQSSTGYVRHHTFWIYIPLMSHLAKHLLTQSEKYWDEWKELDEDFGSLSLRFQPELIAEWKELETRPFIGRDGKPRSLFQVDSAQSECILMTLFICLITYASALAARTGQTPLSNPPPNQHIDRSN